MFRGPVHRRHDGTFAVDLGEPERDVLRTLVTELRSLLTTDSPALARLFPPPYGDDADRNEGYAALAHPELIEHRLAALDVVASTVDATTLDEEQLSAWMRSINDVRLVLGTMLEIEDDDEPLVDEANAATHQAYEYLGYLLERIVVALSG